MKKLIDLQKKIATINNNVWDDPDVSRLLFSEVSSLFHIEYYGEGYDDDPNTPLTDVDEEDNYPFLAVLELLSEISDSISYLTFKGPDEGANGWRTWDFSRLINSHCTFSNLVSFEVELTDPGFHNLSCITAGQNGYEEDGMIASLVKNMPLLENMVIPSAPNSEFFNSTHKKLRCMRIEAGCSSENFISNFASSSGFPNLSALDYSDVSFITEKEERIKEATPYKDFEQLFMSDAFSTVGHFTLRNSILSKEELMKLQALKPDLQFLTISSLSGKYVNHFKK